MAVRRFCSGAPWEPIIGYSRGVLAGPLLFISGTGAVQPDGSVGPSGDMYGQARRSLQVIEACLEAAGMAFADVVRTRVLLTDADRWEEVARAHGEVFGEIRPATTFAEVVRFAEPEMLVEIEAVAYREAPAVSRPARPVA